MGRKKLWTERLLVPLPDGTTARLDAVTDEDEDRLDVIRAGIDRELEVREKAKKPSKRR